MLIKATEQITKISDNPDINAQNYFEFISYTGNLYQFINKLKLVISTKDVIFEPTFKGKYTCQKFGLVATEEENEMKVIVIKCAAFLEDEIRVKIEDIMGPMCKIITFDKDVIKFVLN